jgi:2-(1,2-epoxy-1,2-dihydrophenyl)acetyl-CoA isomerase
VSESVHYELKGAVALVTLNRPHAKNALGREEWAALTRHAETAQADPHVRAIVVTGAGGVFSAGGDIKSMPERLALPFDERRAQLDADARVITLLVEMEKPSVAAIEGAAVGAGLSLALACDVRIAAESARLGATFHRVGLTADFGLSLLLPRAVGWAHARDLCLSSEIVGGRRAEAIGLVSRVVDAGRALEEALDYAATLASGPPLAIACSKRLLRASERQTLAEMLAQEAEAQAECSRTADAREGVAAFLERRAPRFRGE